jgi:hypothetical protein
MAHSNNKNDNKYSNAHKPLSVIDYSLDISGPAYQPPDSDSLNFVANREDNSVIYIDISTEGGRKLHTGAITKPHLIGRLYFELRCDLVPLATTNFLALIANSKGYGSDGVKYAYKGTKFHRIVKNLLIQGGDLLGQNGHCSRSTFGEGKLFKDENFFLRHTGTYIRE